MDPALHDIGTMGTHILCQWECKWEKKFVVKLSKSHKTEVVHTLRATLFQALYPREMVSDS